MTLTASAQKPLQLTYNASGQIDLEALEKRATVDQLKQWMRSRFEGNDPIAPINSDHLEPLYDLFVDLYSRSVVAPRLHACLDQACAELVNEAWIEKGSDWIEWHLRLIATVQPPSVWPILCAIVDRTESFDQVLFERGLDLRWLEAAASYSKQSDLLTAWKRFIVIQRYAQVAYDALSHDLEYGVRYLPQLFDSLSLEERPLLLREALRRLFARDEVALRAAYGVPYSVESLQRLREAYGTLKLRFSDQQSRRQRRRASRYEGLILDLLSMDGRIHRSLTKETAHAYYTSFEQYVFGVSPTKRRDFGSPDGPQIDGILPDFSQLLNMAFSQPVGVVGLDEVTGGLMPTIPAPESQEWIGGLVTLIAGPPGSGKTSLCLSITSRMAELGSIVRYVSTEEESHTLEAKRTTVAEPSAELLWPDVAPLGQTLGNWMVMSGKDFKRVQIPKCSSVRS
jgi:hypothetical protein